MSDTRRGTIAVKTILAIPALAGMVAVVVDLGHTYAAVQDVQIIADSAALAGASALGVPVEVRSRATALASMHQIDGQSVTLAHSDVEIGDWDPAVGRFVPNESTGNAVRVTLPIEVPTAFARLFGVGSVLTRRVAVAAVTPVMLPQPGGPCSIYAGLGLTVRGTAWVDAYHSSTDSYTGVNTATASVCSATDIVLQNGAKVWTDANSIRGLTTQNAGKFYGQARTLDGALSFAPIDWRKARVTNDNRLAVCAACPNGDPYKGTAAKGALDDEDLERGGYWTVDLSGSEVLTLPAGTFSFDQLISTGKSRIDVVGTGVTNLYIHNELRSTGRGLVNLSQDPTRLNVYVRGTRVVQAADSDFHGAVYAPNATIDFSGTADFFGAVHGGLEVVFGGNLGVHIDVAIDPWGATARSNDLSSGAWLRLVQ